MKTPTHKKSQQGFTLIITISLMVLLTLIAIGVLSLSTITLRSAARGDAMSIAKANAKVALMLAIGELQKSAGPDMRVTAPSEITTNNLVGKPRHMGVWRSWNYNPNQTGIDYVKPKDDNFVGWLASDQDLASTRTRNYVAAGHAGETVLLQGARSLGMEKAPDADLIRVGKVPVIHNNKRTGSYAWHVSDESFKTRINTFRDPAQNTTLGHKRALLTGHRPCPSLVKASDGNSLPYALADDDAAKYRNAIDTAHKLPTLEQAELLANNSQIGRYRNSVTAYSKGLPVNVREGGLKQDLSTAFGFNANSMPTEFSASATNRLYTSTHRITGTSDPYWSTLKGYYDVYLERMMAGNNPIYNKAPRVGVTMSQTTPPQQYMAAPVIAKVEMLFSLVVRDSHGPWSPGSTGLSTHTRMIHLLYAPIITLHNPYNTSLQFDKLDLDIKGIPISFNFTVNGAPQNNKLVSLNELFVVGANRLEKSFYISLSNWSSTSSSGPSPITMNPGQTLVCGPFIDGSAIFGNAGHEGARSFFDYSNNLTGNVNARAKFKPGFLGKHVSYDVDWLTLREYSAGTNSTDGGRGTLIVKPTDQFFVEWQAKANTGINPDKMTATAKLTMGGVEIDYGGLEFSYDAGNSALNRLYPTVHRYPDARSVPNTILVEDLYHGNLTPISTHTRAKAFALISAYARNTNGGVYDNKSRTPIAGGLNAQNDGVLAGKPFLHHNPAVNPTVVNLESDVPGNYSYEFNMQPLTGSVDDLFEIDANNRGYSLTANSNKQLRGIKSGTFLELPTAPLQTIADFRRSNALTSTLLPHFVQPVSNSYASPLIATNRVVQTGVVRYPLLDHSVLANHALYDRFYFSSIATFGGRNADVSFREFMNGTRPLLSQVYEPYLTEGKTLTGLQTELFSGGRPTMTTYQKVAQYQMIRGAFNVNSTDVQAWKSQLGSLSNAMIQTLWANNVTLTEKKSTIPILPMTLVNAGAVGEPADRRRIDNQATNDWNGYRELYPEQLELLATKIVEQVRKRGPFLSMSEFVNRRVGPDSELSQSGALQAAIDQSKLNDDVLRTIMTDVRAQDITDPRRYRFANPAAEVGSPAAGAPGWIMQGDLMRIIEPTATVRGDTFLIRVCGEAQDANGAITARAYAEAVIQRVPEYINPANDPSVNVWSNTATNVKQENVAFGRRLKLVSFRWLADSEI